jgi:hypothetical protein
MILTTAAYETLTSAFASRGAATAEGAAGDGAPGVKESA